MIWSELHSDMQSPIRIGPPRKKNNRIFEVITPTRS